jgi:hypothetical protein
MEFFQYNTHPAWQHDMSFHKSDKSHAFKFKSDVLL